MWLLDRRGGEAAVLTDLKGGVSSFEWSPDGTRLALVSTDPDPEAEAREKNANAPPKPIVVTRLQFKRDGTGFLNDLRNHVYVFDVAKKTSMQSWPRSITSSPQGWPIQIASGWAAGATAAS